MRYLLQVTDTFHISHLGLVVTPEIPLPADFTNFTSTVTITPPDSNPFEAEANFFLSHFKPGGFKLFMTLPSTHKSLLPIGSKIFVSQSTYRQLCSDIEA